MTINSLLAKYVILARPYHYFTAGWNLTEKFQSFSVTFNKEMCFFAAKKTKENEKKKVENGDAVVVNGGDEVEAEKEMLNKENSGFVQCLNNINLV